MHRRLVDGSPASFVQTTVVNMPLVCMNRTNLVLLHLCERSLQRLKPACSRVCNVALLYATNPFIRPAHTCASVSLENESVKNLTHS